MIVIQRKFCITNIEIAFLLLIYLQVNATYPKYHVEEKKQIFHHWTHERMVLVIFRCS